MRFLGRSLTGLFLLSLTLGLLGWAGLILRDSLQARMERDSRPAIQRERVFSARVVPVTQATVAPVIEVVGEVVSRRTLDLRAPSAGRIVHLDPAMVEGGRVAADQLLMEIDPAEAQSALDLARTDLADAQAEITDAEGALTLARDDLAAARETARLRRQALQRQRDLEARGVGTDAAVEAAELAASTADQAVLQKRAALLQAQTRVERAHSTLARRQIALRDAERRLADTRLHAGFSGRLTQVSVVQGGLVNRNERVARLVDPDALDVSFRLSNGRFAELLDAEGHLVKAPVTVRLDLLGEQIVATGRITRVSATVAAGQSGRLVFATLDGGDLAAFQPGDFVSVEVREPPLDRVAVLPARAVDSQGAVLVLGPDDRLQEASVVILRHQRNAVIVRPGALVGREVVAERSPLLGPGVRVRPLRSGARGQDPDQDPGHDAGHEAGGQDPGQSIGEDSGGAVSHRQNQAAAERLVLDPKRRARLIAFVEGSEAIPRDRKARLLELLRQDTVPARLVRRIESRMGG